MRTIFADNLSSRQQSVGMVLSLFAMGALWLWHVQKRGLDKRQNVWTAFAVEVVQVGLVLWPAYLGGYAPWTMAALLSVVGAWEAWRLAAHVWPRRFWPRFAAVVAVVLGFFAYAFVASLPHGFFWVLAVYGIPEVHDVAAWLVGGAWGRTKLAPQLSPHKTWEGEIAGLCAGLLYAYGLTRLIPTNPVQIAIFAPWILVGGVAGDLTASWFKRLAQQKDFGAWIPTQGGALDLYDALLMVAPGAAVCHWLLG